MYIVGVGQYSPAIKTCTFLFLGSHRIKDGKNFRSFSLSSDSKEKFRIRFTTTVTLAQCHDCILIGNLSINLCVSHAKLASPKSITYFSQSRTNYRNVFY